MESAPFSSPAFVPLGLSNVIAVAAGDSHSVALKADGTVVAWGLGNDGLTNVPPTLTNVVAISAGSKHALALKADGSVVGWGTSAPSIPVGLTNAVAVSAGRGNSLILKSDGTVLGFGTGVIAALNGLSNIVAISAADTSNCESWLALQADGVVIQCGAPWYGGNATNILANIVAISASRGTDHHISLALRSDGKVTPVLGFNFYKALYCTPFSFPPCPFPDVPAGLTNVIAVASGDQHNLALIGTRPRLNLTSPTWNSDGFAVSVSTESGHVYRLEYKNAMTEGNWQSLPLVAGNGGTRIMSDPNATGTQRFYRVRRW